MGMNYRELSKAEIVVYDAVFKAGVSRGRRVVERDFGDGQGPERGRRSEKRDVGEQMSDAGRASEDLNDYLEKEAQPVHQSSPYLHWLRLVHLAGLAHRRHIQHPPKLGNRH